MVSNTIYLVFLLTPQSSFSVVIFILFSYNYNHIKLYKQKFLQGL
jgi:hypothetical protein